MEDAQTKAKLDEISKITIKSSNLEEEIISSEELGKFEKPEIKFENAKLNLLSNVSKTIMEVNALTKATPYSDRKLLEQKNEFKIDTSR